MKVTLIQYDKDALDLLLFTKQTRLTLSPGTLDEVKAWPMERKMAELEYMRGTIQSSWEMASYTFLVDGVSRAFTHQFVRSRQASFAQQSQRTVNMEGFDYVATGSLSGTGDGTAVRNSTELYIEDWVGGDEVAMLHDGMRFVGKCYSSLIAAGVPPQDARGILPTNVVTNIVGKFNLRTLADMAKIRLCTRTQGEYQDVFRAMRAAVMEVHPWAEPFIRVACAATGVCAFPNFKECPIKGGVFNADSGLRWDEQPLAPLTRNQVQKVWEHTRFEAIPAQGKATK